jgi:hypothetical protein
MEIEEGKDVTVADVEKAAGMPFLEYAILKLEGYGFHFTSHMEWDYMCHAARMYQIAQSLPQPHTIHCITVTDGTTERLEYIINVVYARYKGDTLDAALLNWQKVQDTTGGDK